MRRSPTVSSGPYLVIILPDQLPVILSIGCPSPMVDIVIELEIAQPWLLVGPSLQFFPGDGSFGRIQVDPHKANFVNVSVNLEEAVFLAIKFL